MIKKYLTLLPALALLVFVKQACAIGITSNGYAIETYAQAANATPDSDITFYPTGPASFTAGSTSTSSGAPGVVATVNANYNFTNTSTQASYSGLTNMQNQGTEPFSSSARDLGQYFFTLTEEVDYSISGFLNVLATTRGNTTAEMRVELRNQDTLFPYFSQDIVNAGFPGLANLGNNVFTGSLTGTLVAGNYIFASSSDLRNGFGGTAFSQFLLTLTPDSVVEPPPNGGGNGVPDAGSTVMLLGMALLGLGTIRQKLTIY